MCVCAVCAATYITFFNTVARLLFSLSVYIYICVFNWAFWWFSVYFILFFFVFLQLRIYAFLYAVVSILYTYIHHWIFEFRLCIRFVRFSVNKIWENVFISCPCTCWESFFFSVEFVYKCVCVRWWLCVCIHCISAFYDIYIHFFDIMMNPRPYARM